MLSISFLLPYLSCTEISISIGMRDGVFTVIKIQVVVFCVVTLCIDVAGYLWVVTPCGDMVGYLLVLTPCDDRIRLGCDAVW